MNKDIILGIIRHMLTLGGGALITRGYASNTDVEQLAGALMTVFGVLWSIWQKRSAAGAAAQNIAGKVGILCAALVITALGCKTTPEVTAYRSIGSIAATVDGCMNGWGNYVRAGLASTNEEATVKSAYETYQLAMRAARAAVTVARGSTNTSAWITTADALAAASADVFAIVTKYTTAAPSTAPVAIPDTLAPSTPGVSAVPSEVRTWFPNAVFDEGGTWKRANYGWLNCGSWGCRMYMDPNFGK